MNKKIILGISLCSILFFLLIVSGCGKSPQESKTDITSADGKIYTTDQYAVTLLTDKKTYSAKESTIPIKLFTSGVTGASPFNGVQLFLQLPQGMVLSGVSSHDINMTAMPPKDQGNNVYQVLLYGGNQTADKSEGFATLTFTVNNPSAKGDIVIVDNGNVSSTLTGDQNTDAHAIKNGSKLCTIE